MKNKNILITIGLVLFLITAFAIVLNQKLLNQSETSDNNSFSNLSPTENIKETITPIANTEYSGWIPNWASDSGFTSVKNNKRLFNSISPVWYEVNEDGSLKKTYPRNRQEMIDYAKSNNIKIYPTIAMMDHELFTKVLQNQESFNRHIEVILEMAKNYDGIDMDYESTKLSDKEKYFELISALSSGLKSENKKLIITVLPKWGENILYPSLRETRQVQDWSEINKYADEIRIMAYDFTYIKAYFPGPIAPISWVKDVINYALTKIPAEKIVLGIHLYSYEWAISASEPYDFILDLSANKTGDTNAASYNYYTVKSIIKENNGQISDYDGESIFRYEAGGKKKTLVYQTPDQVKARVDLAKSFELKGVVFWRLGAEEDLIKNF